MAKITINPITAGTDLETALNLRLQQIEDAFNDDVLWRDGFVSEPNTMEVDLDLNGNSILNAIVDATVQPAALGGLVITVLELGNWDMTAVTSVAIPHGLVLSDIRSIQVTVVQNDELRHYNMGTDLTTFETAGSFVYADATDITVRRASGGQFDVSAFGAAASFNRGWIILQSVG